MRFVDALGVLSKSSSFAVSTESDRDEGLTRIKSNLYVAMPIEEDFMSLLAQIHEKLKKCGIVSDVNRSMNIAKWAYAYAQDNNYIFWEIGKNKMYDS